MRIPALAVVAALALAGCGGDDSGGPVAEGGGETTIDVVLADFSITLAETPSGPGTYTFAVSNDGPAGHNLTVEGPGVDGQATSTFGTDGGEQLTVTLQVGTYRLYCSVPGHAEAGMSVELEIGSGGAAPPASSERPKGGYY